MASAQSTSAAPVHSSEAQGTSQAPASNGAGQAAVASGSAGQGAGGMAENPNMHLDTQTGKWIYENPETGQEFEWNTAANAWTPVVEDDLIAAQQAAYSVAGVDETTPANVILARDRKKLKRKAADEGDAEASTSGTSGKPAGKQKQKPGPRNTAVFVQRLPLDATTEEVASVFNKAGLILVDADDKPKIKLYTDAKTGMRNGEGLVIYYKEESVSLAISLLDDSPLRLGDQESMKVAKAEWSHKKEGDADGDEKSKRKVDTQRAQKMQKRAERLQQEAADYDPSYDEKDSPAYQATQAAKSASGGRIAVLAHVFTLEELSEDASLLLDLKEDVRDECESLGKVTNVVLYDNEPDGIVTIKFTDPIAAQACVLKNNDRFFGGRQLKAWIYDGKTRYKRSSAGSESAAREGETEEAAEKRRLEEFGQWLEDDAAA